jgi:hypothetical protein
MEICLALFVHIARTIQHLFFDCHLVKFIWRIVHVCFIKLSLPTSIDHLFNDWLFGINRKLKSHYYLVQLPLLGNLEIQK